MSHRKTSSVSCRGQCRRRGFTLVEIMIVVIIIGMMTAMALPALNRVRETAQNNRTVRDLRTFADAFHMYATETGTYPADGAPATLPIEMAGRISSAKWSAPTAIGGYYDWDFQSSGVTAAVSVSSPTASMEQLLRLDVALDNGDLSSGGIRFNGGALVYVVEQ